jgi:flavorubredoxin
VKVFVVYDSKYGNTKLVAEKIVEGLKEVDGVEAAIGYVKDVDVTQAAAADAVVLGGPNHMGNASRTIMGFVDELAKVNRKTRWVACFDTYMGREKNRARATRKLEKRVSEKLPDVKLTTPGLSIKVTAIKGPIADDELPKPVEFGRKVGAELKQALA